MMFSDLNLDALRSLLIIQEKKSINQAALILGITQSALSQKLKKLEDSLQATLFVRKSHGLEITASGERVLLFAKQMLAMEEDFLTSFQSKRGELKLVGNFRLGTFSSVLRSLILPHFAPFLKKNPEVDMTFSSREVVDLLPGLKSNQMDMVIVDYFPQIPGIEEVKIGVEEYVVIEGKKCKKILPFFLDHGPFDNATETYFLYQGEKIDYQRRFMGDVYSILDAVALGLGRAVMSKHLVEDDERFKIITKKKKYFRPLVACYYRQDFYTKLQKEIFTYLHQGNRRYLNPS